MYGYVSGNPSYVKTLLRENFLNLYFQKKTNFSSCLISCATIEVAENHTIQEKMMKVNNLYFLFCESIIYLILTQ